MKTKYLKLFRKRFHIVEYEKTGRMRVSDNKEKNLTWHEDIESLVLYMTDIVVGYWPHQKRIKKNMKREKIRVFRRGLKASKFRTDLGISRSLTPPVAPPPRIFREGENPTPPPQKWVSPKIENI